MLRGRCLCGGIGDEIVGPVGEAVLSLLNVPQGSRYSFPGKASGSEVVLSFCSRRGLVDELPLVRGHDKEVLPDMRSPL